MEGLEEELMCPVCKELYTCPLQLPCRHNICHRCAEDILQPQTDSSQDDEEVAAFSAAGAPGPEDTTGTFPCPTCHEEVILNERGLDGLGKNFLLQHIADRYVKQKKKIEPIPCQLCKEEPAKMAVKSCLACEVSYCRQCLGLTHPDYTPFSEHELVTPRTSFDEGGVMCTDHPTKPLELYCVQDQTPVCTVCKILGRHQEHNMAALEEVFSQKREELQFGVDRQEAGLTQGIGKVRELERNREYVETRAAWLKSQVEEECGALQQVIRRRSTEINRQVELARREDAEKLDSAKDTTKGAVHKARSSLAYAEEALKETDHGSFLLTEAAVMATLDSTGSVLSTAIRYEHTTYEVDGIQIDLSKTGIREMLESLDIGEPPQTPTIHSQHCSTRLEEACIMWQPVDKADEYEIRYAIDGAVLTATVRGCEFTAKQLNPGNKYIFEIRSRNANGTSSEASIELVTAAPPTAPMILDQYCSTTLEEAYIVWQPVDNADEYEIWYEIDAAVLTATVRGCSFTVKQLSPGTPYTFEIRSRNAIGISHEASSVELVTAAPPAAPMILDQYCSTTLEEAYIVWQPVDNADEYEIRYAIDAAVLTATVRGCEFTAKQLNPGNKYTFAIRSRNANGTSSETSVELVTAAPPAAPMILNQYCSTTLEEAYIMWQPVDNADEYEIRYAIDAAVLTATVRGHSFTAKQLRPGTPYTFEIRSKNAYGTSTEASVELVTAAPPTVPMILGQNCSTTTVEACLEWASVPDAFAYEVLYKVDDVLMSTKVRSNTFTAKKLAPATQYNFNVKSISDAGTSTASSIALFTKAPFEFRLNQSTVDGSYLQLSNQGDCVKVYKTGHLVNAFIGDTPVTNGRHYWEVSVDSISYSVGVAYGDIPTGKDIRLTSRSWAFDRHGTSYYIQHDCKVVAQVEKYVQHATKIGVLVDYDAGELSFYDAGTRALIFGHKTNGFTEPLYPAFSLWHGSINVHSGILCPY
ncbi:MID1 [Branchiostoma lanceolatum]|nr:MID1 [Branchiostoma lanceolatum]